MAVVVNWKWRRGLIGAITWRGRCCAVTFNDTYMCAKFFLCCIHAAHDEFHATSLFDAVWLIRQRPSSSIPLLFGDLNCDLLPAFSNDFFSDLANRKLHHAVERRNLFEAIDPLSMYVCGHNVRSNPKGHDAIYPFTRVPLVEQLGTPSFIDSVCAHSSLVDLQFDVIWDDAPADHAFIRFVLHVASAHVRPRRRFSAWHARSDQEFLIATQANPPPDDMCIDTFVSYMKDMQALTCTPLNRRQRRLLREPFAVKSLRSKLRLCTQRRQRQKIQDEIWNLRRWFYSVQRSRDLVASVRRGRVLQKNTKLHNIEALNTGEHITCDCQSIGTAAVSFFANKWCVDDHETSNASKSWLARDRERYFIKWSVAQTALQRLKQTTNCDYMGVSFRAMYLLLQKKKTAFPIIGLVQSCLNDSNLIRHIELHGVFKSKVLGTPTVEKLRTLLPQAALLSYMNSIITVELEFSINAAMPRHPGIYTGEGTRGTQTLDIGSAISLGIEQNDGDKERWLYCTG